MGNSQIDDAGEVNFRKVLDDLLTNYDATQSIYRFH